MNSLKTTLTKKISKVALSLLALNLVFTSGITAKAAPVTPAAAGATVSYDVTGELKVGNIVDIALNVNGATDLYGASWDLAYDKSLLEVQSVTPGTIFPANVNVPVNKAKTVPGLSEVAMTLTGSDKATATSGTIATMKVKILKEGSVTLKSSNSDAALVATGLNARVKLATSTAANISYTSTDKVINIGPIPENVKIATFVADKASSQAINSTITFTATATPSTGTTYEFAVKEGTAYVTKQAYSPKNTFAWTPTVAGNYAVKVTAKGSNGSTDSKELAYVITNPGPVTLAITSFVADKQNQPVGSAVKFTALANTPGVVYDFYVRENRAWSQKQAYSSSNTFSWIPNQVGTYTIRVRAKLNNTLSYKDITYVVTKSSVVAKMSSFTSNKVSGQPSGSTIQFTAVGNPGSQYDFWVKENGVWVEVQKYSYTNTFNWTPSKAGTYAVRARAKINNTFDYKDMTFIIK